MEFGDFVGVSAIIVAIFLATAIFIWQSGRSDTRIDRLEAEVGQQGEKLHAEIREWGVRLEAEIREQGRRVSDSELEQARLNGVNSVLANQAHTHEG